MGKEHFANGAEKTGDPHARKKNSDSPLLHTIYKT